MADRDRHWHRNRVRWGKRAVSQYVGHFEAPPKHAPSNASTDAPLMGNGDMGVALSGPPEHLRLWLNKNDFWRLQHQYGGCKPALLGGIDIQTPALAQASYSLEQDLYSATTSGEFTTGESTLSLNAFVAATANVLVVELAVEGKPIQVSLKPWIQEGSGSLDTGGEAQGVYWIARQFQQDVDIPTGACAALKICDLGALGFEVRPGQPIALFVTIDSTFKSSDCIASAVDRASALTASDAVRLAQEHREWWADYWSKCIIDIPDKVIEREYYRALYVLGSCSRDPEFPPPIFGTWNLTDTPAWHGDYHMNYNHVAPFYGLYSANRLEQADPCTAPLMDFIPRGQEYARTLCGTRGVLYPVGIGPKGMDSTYRGDEVSEGYRNSPNVTHHVLHFGQKSNAAYSLVPVQFRFYSTWDVDYAQKHYPLVLEVVDFWEDYLQFENGRYVIHNDAIHEGSGDDFNPILSLGLVRMAFQLAFNMSERLDVDQDRRDTWAHILRHLSDYTTQDMDGKTVFRYTEKGTAWWRDNTLGIQHIYPAGVFGLESDPKWLEVACNTIEVMGRWMDFNGTNSFYPAAVRVGYPPESILRNLHDWAVQKHPNGLKHAENPHGIELCTPVIATINMMLCMGHQGVLRVFGNWPRELDARFADVRAFGGFLVSSQLRDGDVEFVCIHSEAGRICTIENPWPDTAVLLSRDGNDPETQVGDYLTFTTNRGETLQLEPEQTSQVASLDEQESEDKDS